MIRLSDRERIGYEALARFADGRSPIDHLLEARHDGTLIDLELDLIASAVRACSDLPSDIMVTVNASAGTILDARFARLLPREARTWGVELSERSLLPNAAALARRVADLDVLLLVDDAGAFHANEARIRDLRPDVVKVDKQILWDAVENDAVRDQFIALINAAKEVNARSIVEGVETEAMARFAEEVEVDFAQGFYFGRPAPLPQAR